MGRYVIQRITIVGLVGVLLAAVFLIAQACREQTASLPERTVDVTYRLAIRDIPAGAKQITAWVPVPPSNTKQRLESFYVEGNSPYTTLVEPEYGNRFIRFDLSDANQGNDSALAIAVTFRVNRTSYRPLDVSKNAETAPQASLARYLAPDRLVPIDGKLAEEAKRIAGGVKGVLTQARYLYDHIVQSVSYDKSGVGWGRGDANYACDVRKGNCTDFHSLFIGEARSLGIPARFIMGLSLPEGKSEGDIPGYHCWAEFYVKDKGWIPVDASEASKFPEKKEFFFGSLDENRVEFAIGRDIRFPGASADPLNYIIYPHVEVDGQSHKKVKTSLSF